MLDLNGTSVSAVTGNYESRLVTKDENIKVLAGSILVIIPNVAGQIEKLSPNANGNRVFNLYTKYTNALKLSANLLFKG